MENKILVTGGTGFLGMRLIAELVKKGYEVKTTVRSLKSKDKVLHTLKENGIDAKDRLSFAEADLLKDENWEQVMIGCDYVFSVASPVFFDMPEDENEVIRPAVEGITRILKAAKKAGVKRVVMTSNFGAVGFSNFDRKSWTTEKNWTDPNEKGLSAYEKSKLLAEQVAWKFIEEEGEGMEFATINPVAIFGPSLDRHVSGSFDLLKGLLTGSMKRIINLPLNVVDVRDVVDLHIRAMFTPEANMQRFIASADGQITMEEIADLIRKERPGVAEKIAKKTLPNWLIDLAALFNKRAGEGKMMLRVNRQVSNEKAKKLLDWTPIATNEEAVLQAVDSMEKYGVLTNG